MSNHSAPVATQTAVRFIVAVFFHWRNSRAADDLCARIALDKDPYGNPQIATRADGAVFTGIDDVDHGTKGLVLDIELRAQARRILQYHKDAGIPNLEVHYVHCRDGQFDFVADPSAPAPVPTAAELEAAKAAVALITQSEALTGAAVNPVEPPREDTLPATPDAPLPPEDGAAEAPPAGAVAASAGSSGGTPRAGGRRAHTGAADGAAGR